MAVDFRPMHASVKTYSCGFAGRSYSWRNNHGSKGLIHVDAGRRNGMRMIGHMTRRYKEIGVLLIRFGAGFCQPP